MSQKTARVASLQRAVCPLWVNSGHVRRKTSCPLYPRKRTCAVHQRMSALGQKRTSRIPSGSLTLVPVDRMSCAIRLGDLVYQIGEAATKLSIKNVFDAFYAFIMRERIKLTS